ncbi:hypothetical protein [Actinoplanes campanulatus]|nr:hypothetical protein [Actinoplanes capillaceus]
MAAVAAASLFPVLVAPAVPALAAVVATPTIVQATEMPTVGKAARFRLRVLGDEAATTAFMWQLNTGPWQESAATAGKATVTVVPDRFTNVLSVYAVGADGSLSDTSTLSFNAEFPPLTADQDLDSDGRPDLLTPGGTAGLSEGLWLATGRGERGKVRVPAVNIGGHGTGLGEDPSGAEPAAAFTGTQIVTGKFTGGPFEDVFVYHPNGPRAGLSVIIPTLGNGAELRPELSGNGYTLPAGWLSDWDGNQPTQLTNGYDADGSNPEYPDLFAIMGSPAAEYNLSFYSSYPGIGNYAFPVVTGASTPTGGIDWQNWRMASALLPTGTAIVLWNRSTGALYLWKSVIANPDTGALTYQQHHLSDNWLPGADLSTLQLADVNADGTPDLRTVTGDGKATAYRITEVPETGTLKITTGAAQSLA